MSRLAIIIPFSGNSKRLEDTLVSVLENRPDDCEILVVLAEPYENPYALDDEVSFVPAPPHARFAASVNAAWSRTEAPIVHVLAPGVEATEGWADAAIAQFDDPAVAAVAPVVLNLQAKDRVLAAGIEYCRSGRVLPRERGRRSILVDRVVAVPAPHPAAAFYRRSALEMVGGFPEDVGDLLAPLDLALVFRHLGLRTVLEPESQVAASAAEKSPTGAFRTAMEAERFFWRWARCEGWTGGLAGHLLHAAGDCLRGVTDLSLFARAAGRFAGLCRGGDSRKNASRLHQLEELNHPSAVHAPKPAPRRDGHSSAAIRPAHPPGTNGCAAARVVRKAH